MVKHLVFFRMAEEADGRSGTENARLLVEKLRALSGEIAELKGLEAGVDFTRSGASYDVGLYTVFDSRETLEAYRAHPKHQEVVAWINQVTTDRAAVDYED